MFILHTTIAVLVSFLAVIAYDKFRTRLSKGRSKRKDVEIPLSPTIAAHRDVKPPRAEDGGETVVCAEEDAAVTKEMQSHKHLYYKLHNLERNPDILPECRELLLSLLSSTVTDAQKHTDDTILAVEDFSSEKLSAFLKTKDDDVTNAYEEYIARRKAGGPREMFADKTEAKWWLKQAAPVKYVDGAWLGHINKITTPFMFRNITKNAWQVMSEELGDGDLAKNHVHVYRALMDEIDSGLPAADSEDFIDSRHHLDEARCWEAAVAQLLISLFAHEFLPEALGFNMAYESLPLHLLKTIKELREVRLNAYYFELHICIDNADTGHAAMAMATVVDYINLIEQTEGKDAAEVAWRRVQAGYILAEGLPTTPESPSLKMKRHHETPFPRSETEASVIEIFAAKCAVAHKIHCNSRLKIGRRSLVDWLEPRAFADPNWQREFLHDLACCKPWIIKGNSEKSRLVRELSWEGRMFGSFTQSEVEIVKAWINELGAPPQTPSYDPQVYFDFTKQSPPESSGRESHNSDILEQYPVLSTTQDVPAPIRLLHENVIDELATEPPVDISSINLHNLLPLWFASTALLESLPSVPVRAADTFGSALIRVLRAQTGFDLEGPGVAGMEEVRRTDSGEACGIVELGLEMCARAGIHKPQTLKEAVTLGSAESAALAEWMLWMGMRWLAYRDVLVGMSWAFMEVHEALGRPGVHEAILSDRKRTILGRIAGRERIGLETCRQEIERTGARRNDFERGIAVARRALRSAGSA
ncbi:uncharacterized protein N0V89_006053 [Didymosphaeria variabile]|uniref:Heme oxygenase-like protein n=1 Tax=Didymosphaeria variabile TaxID=1932322 RepID=A0A9W8XP26_9PLEO|nr:uncharacterized protein N0V89_006053 [Didymosphaeria variabile]KAJ4354318.1 hypothetical protein N0V89_006053 [Didymosphaeria variabile]